MSDLGLLLFGYNEEDAKAIKTTFTDVLGSEIHLIGTANTDRTVSEVLDSMDQEFSDADPKILMLLGFDDAGVQAVLKGFPIGVQRPIFCGLTEENMNWTIGYLAEHLLEEQRYWKEQAEMKKKKAAEDKMKQEMEKETVERKQKDSEDQS
jgi:hypothetical protein